MVYQALLAYGMSAALVRTVNIGGTDVPMCASAALPRLYRHNTGKDLFADMQAIGDDATNQIDFVESLAYTMAKYADPTVPDNINEWLGQFPMLAMYEAMPQVLELWGLNSANDVDSKKNSEQPTDL